MYLLISQNLKIYVILSYYHILSCILLLGLHNLLKISNSLLSMLFLYLLNLYSHLNQ